MNMTLESPALSGRAFLSLEGTIFSDPATPLHNNVYFYESRISSTLKNDSPTLPF
jgi:hypothetical protein